MRVLICGDRNWSNRELMALTIDNLIEYYNLTTVIEGEARGADTMAREEAEKRGIPVLGFPADWKRYGRGAGPIRNQRMLDEGLPDLVLAFHNDLASSKGTRDMVNRCLSVPYEIISEDGRNPWVAIDMDRFHLNWYTHLKLKIKKTVDNYAAMPMLFDGDAWEDLDGMRSRLEKLQKKYSIVYNEEFFQQDLSGDWMWYSNGEWVKEIPC